MKGRCVGWNNSSDYEPPIGRITMIVSAAICLPPALYSIWWLARSIWFLVAGA